MTIGSEELNAYTRSEFPGVVSLWRLGRKRGSSSGSFRTSEPGYRAVEFEQAGITTQPEVLLADAASGTSPTLSRHKSSAGTPRGSRVLIAAAINSAIAHVRDRRLFELSSAPSGPVGARLATT